MSDVRNGDPLRRPRCNSEPLRFDQHASKLYPDADAFERCLKMHLDNLRVVLLSEHKEQLEHVQRGSYPHDVGLLQKTRQRSDTSPSRSVACESIGCAPFDDARKLSQDGQMDSPSSDLTCDYKNVCAQVRALSSDLSSAGLPSQANNDSFPSCGQNTLGKLADNSTTKLEQTPSVVDIPGTCSNSESVVGPLSAAKIRSPARSANAVSAVSGWQLRPPIDYPNGSRSNRPSIMSMAPINGLPQKRASRYDATMLDDHGMYVAPATSPSFTSQAPLNHSISLIGSLTKTSLDSEENGTAFLNDVGTFYILPGWGESKEFKTQNSSFFEAFRTDSADTPALTGNVRCILSPNSMRRLLWNIISIACISFDTWNVPLEILSFPKADGFILLSWWTRMFWSVDIVASFLTGYVKSNGDVVMDRKQIVSQYFKTWFLFDLVIVSCDWSELLLSEDVAFTSTTKSVRVIRLLRIVRLLRLARTSLVVEHYFEQKFSEKLAIMTNLIKVTSLLVGLIHIFACIWFALGEANSSGWMRGDVVHEFDYWYYYALSFHWSISQFHGYSDVEPRSLGERIFANVASLFSFIVATWIVSGLTSSMTRLDLIAGKTPAQFSVLRRFLRCHGISHKLSTRVQLNATHMLKLRRKRIPESEVELLELISEPVMKELHFEMHSPPLMDHPAFNHYADAHPSAMRMICHSAVTWMSLTVGDLVFCAGEQPVRPQMLIPTGGSLSYLTVDLVAKSRRTAQFQNDKKVEVLPHEWICEAALWTVWFFRGDLSAKGDCQLLAVDGDALQEIAKTHQKEALRKYAVEYVRELNRIGNDITDLGKSIDSSELIRRAYGVSRGRDSKHQSTPFFREFGGNFAQAGSVGSLVSRLAHRTKSDDFSRVSPA